MCREIVEDPRNLGKGDVRPHRIAAVLKEGEERCARLELRRK